MSFKVGDLAIFDTSGRKTDTPSLYAYHGQTVEIIGKGVHSDFTGGAYFEVTFGGDKWQCTPDCLRPLPPPRTVTTWDECKKVAGWKPNGVTA